MENWTEELLNLMVEKMSERKKGDSEPVRPSTDRMVSDSALFKQLGKRLKVVKKDKST